MFRAFKLYLVGRVGKSMPVSSSQKQKSPVCSVFNPGTLGKCKEAKTKTKNPHKTVLT